MCSEFAGDPTNLDNALIATGLIHLLVPVD
jgi:hypothetical protein